MEGRISRSLKFALSFYMVLYGIHSTPYRLKTGFSLWSFKHYVCKKRITFHQASRSAIAISRAAACLLRTSGGRPGMKKP